MRFFSNTQEGLRYTMCNVCNSCHNYASTSACSNLRNALLTFLFGNYSSSNSNGNGSSNCCCSCGCARNTSSCGCCSSNWNNYNCCGCLYGYNGWTANSSATNGDTYYASQYGLLQRSGGVCGNTCARSCGSCN